ncbi:hypothetical protein BZG36_02727 [Bifiguratus adelaidae]|uniref:Uncharacterized protein n=1 Tax=Bifiguratus adelaidae TaxID=1938954 RepID=A0A261XYM1_9FUNG|nr:hypothetical protein BZG36_02727 [Bifiguratus adelaidae]
MDTEERVLAHRVHYLDVRCRIEALTGIEEACKDKAKLIEGLKNELSSEHSLLSGLSAQVKSAFSATRPRRATLPVSFKVAVAGVSENERRASDIRKGHYQHLFERQQQFRLHVEALKHRIQEEEANLRNLEADRLLYRSLIKERQLLFDDVFGDDETPSDFDIETRLRKDALAKRRIYEEIVRDDVRYQAGYKHIRGAMKSLISFEQKRTNSLTPIQEVLNRCREQLQLAYENIPELFDDIFASLLEDPNVDMTAVASHLPKIKEADAKAASRSVQLLTQRKAVGKELSDLRNELTAERINIFADVLFAHTSEDLPSSNNINLSRVCFVTPETSELPPFEEAALNRPPAYIQS